MKKAKIDPKKFGLAVATAAAVLWTIYSLTVFLLTFLAIFLFSDSGNVDFFAFDYKPQLVKFILVMYLLMLGAGITGKMIAGIYNISDRKIRYETTLKDLKNDKRIRR